MKEKGKTNRKIGKENTHQEKQMYNKGWESNLYKDKKTKKL